jgi:hypothetical protein
MRLQDVKGDVEWSALEAELLRCAPLGDVASLDGKEDCPADTTDPDRRVRPALIRWLLLGGHSADRLRTHPKGAQLLGAWVDGELDFEGCKTRLDCSLWACLFPGPVTFQDAEVRGLYLPGSHCRQGLNLVRLKTETDVHLSDAFKAEGLVNLIGARIGGQLACDGGQFLNPGHTALDCDAAQIASDVFLRGKSTADGGIDRFRAEGEVNFVRATVDGTLEVQHATLNGGFVSAAMTVKGRLFWQDVTGSRDTVNMRQSNVAVLRDDKHSWNGVGALHLDGLTYDRIDSAMTVADRIAWLDRNHDGTTGAGSRFLPQPWTQLAKVLTAMGHRRAASRVREAREVRMAWAEFAEGRARARKRWRLLPVVLLQAAWSAVFRGLFGYGHAPGRVWFTIIPLLIGTAALFGHIYDMGQMAPNSAVILTSADWQAALRAAGDAGQPLFHWAGMHGHPPMPSAIDYETFSSLLYAFDLFIPLDAIGQQQAWAPSHDRGFWGAVGYWARFPIQVAGWVIAAVGAAVVTGLLGKKDDG